MKIIHVSDLHLDGGYNLVGSDKNRILRDESLDLFSQLVRFAKQNDVSAILICGDLFDKMSVRKSTFRFLIDEINLAKEITFFYCLGNHDHELLFEENLPKNLIVFPTYFQKYQLGDVVIGGASLQKNSENKLNIDFEEEKFNIMMLHANLTTSKSGEVVNLNLKDIKNKNIDYLALGHIHMRLNGKIDNRGEWVYSGNGGKYGFGDHKRGFVLMHIQDGKISWERKDFNVLREFVEEEIFLDNISSFKQLEGEIMVKTNEIDKKNFVRITLKGECDEDFDKKIDFLTTKFADSFFYFELLDETKIRIDIEKCRKETLSLKAEMINLILNSKLEENQKQTCIKIGISALRGEEVEL